MVKMKFFICITNYWLTGILVISIMIQLLPKLISMDGPLIPVASKSVVQTTPIIVDKKLVKFENTTGMIANIQDEIKKVVIEVGVSYAANAWDEKINLVQGFCFIGKDTSRLYEL